MTHNAGIAKEVLDYYGLNIEFESLKKVVGRIGTITDRRMHLTSAVQWYVSIPEFNNVGLWVTGEIITPAYKIGIKVGSKVTLCNMNVLAKIQEVTYGGISHPGFCENMREFSGEIGTVKDSSKAGFYVEFPSSPDHLYSYYREALDLVEDILIPPKRIEKVIEATVGIENTVF